MVVFGIVEHLIDDQTFPTVWLGMWWALETVTTVGYGDVVPQDGVGRVIASFLLLGGLALLSVVTATVTSGFVARAQRETRSDAEAELLAEIRELRGRVDELAERQSGDRATPSGSSSSAGRGVAVQPLPRESWDRVHDRTTPAALPRSMPGRSARRSG